jgi:hypothetical protein
LAKIKGKMKKVLFFLSVLAFVSCSQENSRHNNKIVCKNSNWKRFDNVEFKFPVKTTDTLDYDMVLTYNVKKFHPAVFPVNITFYTPNGEVRSKDYPLRLVNYRTNKRAGEIIGDTVIFTQHIRSGMTYGKPGELKIVFENKNTKTETPGIISLELLVKKSNKK